MRERYEPLKRGGERVVEDFQYGDYGFSKKEIVSIIVVIIIASFISFFPQIPDDPLLIFYSLIIFSVIIFSTVVAKKIAGRRRAIKVEHKFWEFSRYGIYKRSHLKKPFPIGLVLPFFLAFFSLGYIKPMVFLQFNVENIPHIRLLKASGYKRAFRKEFVHEVDPAYAVAAGLYVLAGIFVIGFVMYKFSDIDFFYNLAKFSVMYGAWNLLPVSTLDGAKLFFGSFFNWCCLAILYLLFSMMIFM
ncbi:MAG: hypothetical protein RL557_851 [archaeon]|jgi:hypothetical protein